MGLFKPHKGAKYRRFDYEPRYYDPKKDEQLQRHERLKRRMRIERKRVSSRRSPTFLYMLLLLIGAVFIIARLG